MNASKRYTSKRKRRHDSGALDLEGKVAASGGSAAFGLEDTSSGDEGHGGNVGSGRSNEGGSTRRPARRFHSTDSHNASQSCKESASASGSITNPYKNSGQRRYSRRSTSSKRTHAKARASSNMPRAAVHIVCAIGENLANETCVASLNAGSPVCLQVSKQANSKTYAQTLAYLKVLSPHEVLLNEGRQNSQLAQKVRQLFGGDQGMDPNIETREDGTSGACKTSTVVKFISRSCFDQTRGAELLRRVSREDSYDASLVEEYIVLSSAHAALHYTQHCLGATFSRNSLQLNFTSGGNNRMSIDRSTLLQLEVLANAKTGKAQNSLISAIDRTKTTVGGRLLRTTLMAPPCRVDTISARLDLVDAILSDEDFFYTVLEHLDSLPDMDKMLSNVAIGPSARIFQGDAHGAKPGVSVRIASKGISALVCIKTTLTVIPAFADALAGQLDKFKSQGDTTEGEDSSLPVGLGHGPSSLSLPSRHNLMRAIINAMRAPALAEVLQAVSDIFTRSTSFSRSPSVMRHQECFALKSSDNGMMGILREKFVANVDAIYEKADSYAETLGVRVKVKYTANRGYFLSLPGEIGTALPAIFRQASKAGNYINCTTEEVFSLNTRAQDNVNDLLLMTNEKIKEVLDIARSNYDALASLADAIALLDLCHSFADNVTLSKLPWCRPVLSDRGDIVGDGDRNNIAICKGRYAIEVVDSWHSADGSNSFVPNDTYATEQANFTLITGVNGSGKSTYLKQIAIIVLLAHCGSYVPAEQASIPIRNSLSARISTADDQESNISSFMFEMKETASICSNSGTKALILFDELGRATSNEDGIAIAWSVSEFLMSTFAMTFFVTHYPQLCRLSSIYPGAQNQHLEASISDGKEGEVHYTHRIVPGPCTIASNYGVDMASSCGWPLDVSENAREIESRIKGQLPDSAVCDAPSSRHAKARADALSLKSTTRKVANLFASETSINELRSKLKLLTTSSSQSSRSYLIAGHTLRDGQRRESQSGRSTEKTQATPSTSDIGSTRTEKSLQISGDVGCNARSKSESRNLAPRSSSASSLSSMES